jgi:hypothetical protein
MASVPSRALANDDDILVGKFGSFVWAVMMLYDMGT